MFNVTDYFVDITIKIKKMIKINYIKMNSLKVYNKDDI